MLTFFFTQDVFESRFSKIPDEPRNAAPTSDNTKKKKKKRLERAPSLSSSDSSGSESSSPSENTSDTENEEERAHRLASLEEQVIHYATVVTPNPMFCSKHYKLPREAAFMAS